MAKNKKRGFFSWLGFGKEEEKEQQDSQTVDTASEEELATLAQAADAEQTSAQEPPAPQVKETAEDTPSPVAETSTEPTADSDTLSMAARLELDGSTEALEEAISSAVQEIEPETKTAAPLATDELLSDEKSPDETAELAQSLESASEELDVNELKQAHDSDEASEVAEEPINETALTQALASAVDELETELDTDHVAQAHIDTKASQQETTTVAAKTPSDDKEEEKEEEAQLAQEHEELDKPSDDDSQDAATEDDELSDENEEAQAPTETPVVEQEKPARESFFTRLKRGLLRTKQNLGSAFFGLFKGRKIDDDLFDELEEQLLIADVGIETSQKIIHSLTQHVAKKKLNDAEALYTELKKEMAGILDTVSKPLEMNQHKPFVILMVGVNGVGKTTTIGKLARQYQQQGKSVMLAAGDTFRAAAVEQLQVWGERNHIPVIAQHTGSDSASVIYDALEAAKARNVDILIADTAGRLQNKAHLMEELKKIVRVMKKIDPQAPHEIMLTLDASTGQNAISQAKLFNEAIGLTGITLTKLDGTAKGGVIFAIADQFAIPIRYIGIGEGIEDLRPFQSNDFIEALFAREEHE